MKKYLCLLIVACVSLIGCKKFVDPGDPSTQLVRSTVFSGDGTATSAQVGIYSAMEADGLAFRLALYGGLSADELTNYSGSTPYVDLASNNLTPENSLVQHVWSLLYKYNYQANSVLEGIANSDKLSQTVKQQLQGEAYFVRAFCHYYLAAFFGDVPVVLATDYRVNAVESRKPVPNVYEQIISDLNKAAGFLPGYYVSGNNSETAERVRPNKYTALALLARVFLETGNWTGAEQAATEIISQGGIYTLDVLENVFNKDSWESIWQLMAVIPGYNSHIATEFILVGPPATAALSDTLINSFEAGDNRRTAWIGELDAGQLFYYPFKYKVNSNASDVTEHTVLFRLAEQYLIRAEARANQDKLTEALEDINAVRNRAGLSPVSPATKEDVLAAISHERKIELFSENAHRWIDLKRMKLADAVLSSLKSPDWQSHDQLYPIPQNERNKNPNLTQNQGY